MTQTAYPHSSGCQTCLPYSFPAETTTGCSFKVSWEAASCPLLSLWLSCSGLKRTLGSLSPGYPAPRVALRTSGGPHPPGCPSITYFNFLQFLLCKIKTHNLPPLCWLSNICKADQLLLLGLPSSEGRAARTCLF